VKAALGWEGEVILTSGASEALALAIRQSVQPLVAVSAVEHEAVLRHAGNAALLPVDGAGRVDPAACALAGLVAVQQVNNETGVIQPLAEIAGAVRGAGGLLLADAAQGAGKIALPDADLIALSAHKFGGPIGVGALLVRDWAMLRPTGGQERGYRPGTENLPGAMAIGGEVVAAAAPRLPTIGAYRMPGKSANAQLIRFDGQGIAVSAGSACSSGSLRTSHVLEAMGLEGAGEVIRVSIGRETTEAQIDRFIAAWRAVAGA